MLKTPPNLPVIPQKEINRSPNTSLNLLTIIKATAYDLPFVPIRQTLKEVYIVICTVSGVLIAKKFCSLEHIFFPIMTPSLFVELLNNFFSGEGLHRIL